VFVAREASQGLEPLCEVVREALGLNALLACLLGRCLASPAPPRPNLVRRWRCPMQHQEHDRHEADGEHQEAEQDGDDGPPSRVAETPGDDDVDRHRYAGKPEYGGERYRGDDPDNEEERVHHSTALPMLARGGEQS